MNDSLIQDFDIALSAAAGDGKPASGAAGPAVLPSTHVTLTHRASGATEAFDLHGVLCGLDKLIELHVQLRFPDSDATAKLRQLAGDAPCRLPAKWEVRLARKVTLGLAALCTSSGAGFWWHQLETLPQVVLYMLYHRTEERFKPLTGTRPLREFTDALRRAWTDVLHEACDLGGWRDLKLTELHKKGWPVTTTLESRSHEQLEAIAERARLAYLALPYLSDQDWQLMLGFVLHQLDEPSSTTELGNV